MLQDILPVAEEQVEAAAQAVAQVAETAVEAAEPAAEVVAEATSSLTDMLLMAGIGFGVVFAVLVLLIYVMRLMGWFFTRDRKPKSATTVASSEPALDHAISDQEIAAAITTALKLYKSALHDQESEMLTISRITRAYSPWNSKIHGLTQVPEKK